MVNDEKNSFSSFFFSGLKRKECRISRKFPISCSFTVTLDLSSLEFPIQSQEWQQQQQQKKMIQLTNSNKKSFFLVFEKIK